MLVELNDSIRIFRTELLTTKSCGNKQFKLTNNLLALKRSGANRVLSFGGVWSNHLHAFAVACNSQGLESVAIVRGEPSHNSMLLNDAVRHGIEVHYVSRSEYRRRHDESYIRERMRNLGCDAWLPEGGSNEIAVKSCEEIASLINRAATELPANIALAVGTGATMAGIANGALAGQSVIGIPVVQDSRIRSCVNGWISPDCVADWRLLEPAVPQKYGKVDQSLLEFVLEVFHNTGVILDPVYNAKALRSLLNISPEIVSANNCVFVHTGGLGGCFGFADELQAIDSRIASQLLTEASRLLDFAA